MIYRKLIHTLDNGMRLNSNPYYKIIDQAKNKQHAPKWTHDGVVTFNGWNISDCFYMHVHFHVDIAWLLKWNRICLFRDNRIDRSGSIWCFDTETAMLPFVLVLLRCCHYNKVPSEWESMQCIHAYTSIIFWKHYRIIIMHACTCM